MKRVLLLLVATFLVASVYGQNIRSKNGERVLPQAEDWSIGIDANPFFSYLKGLIGQGNNATSPSVNYLLGNQMITGKYFLQSDLAVRASLRIGVNSNTRANMVGDRSSSGSTTFPDLPPMVENEMKMRGSAFGLSGGIEKRRGNTRLQGFYGGELGFWTSSNRQEFSYGNALSTSATDPVNVDGADAFSGANNLVNDTYGNAARVTDRDLGSTFQFGLRGFVGAEYFIFPKISIGGEFGWGLGFQSTRGGETTTESIDAGLNDYGTQTIENGDSNGFSLDTDNTNSLFGPSGSIRINLHF
jgi:hypothetical protein